MIPLLTRVATLTNAYLEDLSTLIEDAAAKGEDGLPVVSPPAPPGAPATPDAPDLVEQPAPGPAPVIVVDTVVPADVIDAARPIGYITSRMPIADERRFTDYSAEDGVADLRDRMFMCGADIARLDRLIPYEQQLEPEADVDAINEAIQKLAGKGGGVVLVKAAASMTIAGKASIRAADRVVVDLTRVDMIRLRGRFTKATRADEVEDFAIIGVHTDANGDACYAFRSSGGCRNYVIQNFTAAGSDQNAIDIGRDQGVTVRYCDVDAEDHGGRFRRQHCVVCRNPGGRLSKHPKPSRRFGIVYTVNVAIYSCRLSNADGYGIDAHVANLEVMGNRIHNCRHSVKFPHGANVVFYNNSIDGSVEGDPWTMRIWAGNEYLLLDEDRPELGSVGYDGDQIYVMRCRFGNRTRTNLRIEHWRGEMFFIDCSYSDDTRFHVESPDSSKARIWFGPDDFEVGRSVSGMPESKFRLETDPGILACEPQAIADRMNAPRLGAELDTYQRYPLPPMRVMVH